MSKQTNPFQQLIAMVVELLEDGAIVEESKLFEDPDTGVPREVDVYALIRGKVNQRETTIAVECVDRSKPMDAPWVEMIYGKHSRLNAADHVLLVSSKGFYRPAKIKAEKFGYKTITPTIAPKELEATLGLANDFKMSAKMMLWEFDSTRIRFGMPPVLGYRWDNEPQFVRADGTDLVALAEYQGDALLQELIARGMGAFVAAEASNYTPRVISVSSPAFAGEPLHVFARSPTGRIVIDTVEWLSFTARGEASDRADFEQTDIGDFDGHPIGTGVSTLDGKPGRMVVTETADGGMKALGRWQYYVKP